MKVREKVKKSRWGSGGSKSRLAKAAGAEKNCTPPCGAKQMSNSKC